jgi:Fic family protein
MRPEQLSGGEIAVPYDRILPLPDGFTDAEANSVEGLRDAWKEQREGLAEGGALSAFNERLVRRWSIETGIIERLYTLDRGTTELLISQGLDAALIEHGASDLPADELVTILEDHRDAAAYIMDHVTNRNGLTGHFIKSVHSLLTRNQEFVEGQDQFGKRIRVALRRGEWKVIPNNPLRATGTLHEYCPPVLVAEEIENLLRFYQEMLDRGEPSVIKAAWLHHRFTQIHPFHDGNGRTARALTAFVFVTDDGFPIVVDRDIRDQYIGALEKADDGDLRPLVRLFSLLEKKELEQALSISEDVLSKTPESNGSLREKLLAALRERARAKRLSITARRQRVISMGTKVFMEVLLPIVNNVASELGKILAEELPGSEVRVELSDETKRHFFKTQIVQIAQREGYYGDFETTHEWVRLRLQRPGESETDMNEIVISMHSLGRHFTGVLVISAYFATRFLDETGRSVTLEPHSLAERSLTFSYLEDERNIAERVREWTNSAIDLGIAELQASM